MSGSYATHMFGVWSFLHPKMFNDLRLDIMLHSVGHDKELMTQQNKKCVCEAQSHNHRVTGLTTSHSSLLYNLSMTGWNSGQCAVRKFFFLTRLLAS